MAANQPRRLLLTGAAGRIGTALRRPMATAFAAVRAADLGVLEAIADNEETVASDLTDSGACQRLVAGCDAILHLAGHRNVRDRRQVFEVGVRGTYNLFEAARQADVRRIVYASSLHAIGMYPFGAPIGPRQPARPDSFYAVSKLFGESMLQYYHEKLGIDAVCLQIGSFLERPASVPALTTWLSPDDLVAITLAALTTPAVGFRIVHAISTNARIAGMPTGLSEIGATPSSNAEAYADAVLAVDQEATPLATYGWDYDDPEC